MCKAQKTSFHVMWLSHSNYMYPVSAHLGCYKENLRRRVYDLNPGNVIPGSVTQEACMKACGLKYLYAAISKG